MLVFASRQDNNLETNKYETELCSVSMCLSYKYTSLQMLFGLYVHILMKDADNYGVGSYEC